jgi:hypothetical protein
MSPREEETAAQDAYIRIKGQIIAARLPFMIDEIIGQNGDDLRLINRLSNDSHEDIMKLAQARKSELLASA